MSADAVPVTVSHAGFTVTSTDAEDVVRETLGAQSDAEETAAAAQKLGKKGGKAAAEARKAKKDDQTAEPPSDPGSDKAPEKAEPDKKPDAKAAKPEHEKEADDADDADKAKPKPRDSAPSRIEQLQGQISRLAAERRDEEAKLAKLRQEREALERPEPKRAEPQRNAGPDPNDSEKYPEGRFDPQYLADVIDHKVEQRLKAENERRAKDDEQRSVQRFHEERATKVSEAYAEAEKDEAYVERLRAIPLDKEKADVYVRLMSAAPWDLVPREQRTPDNLITHWLFSSPVAPLVTLHLAEHPHEYQRIVTLGPESLLRELAMLEADIRHEQKSKKGDSLAATAGTAKEPEHSKAPRPARPVAGTVSAVDGASYREGMSLEEYARGWKRR